MNRATIATLAVVGANFSLLAVAAPAGATAPQVTPASSAVPQNDQPSDDIVVTANRREQSLLDVPIAITAIDGESLEKRNVTETADLGQVVPGLVFVDARGSATPFLRGVGTLNNNVQVEGPTAVYIDGIYVPTQSAALQSLRSVERVEVLKGPQGTLFGRNSTGGLINIITRTPSSTPNVEAQFGYGNFDTVAADFYGTTGIVPSASIDLTASYMNRGEGFGNNPTINEEVNKLRTFTARSKLVVDFGSVTTVTVSGDYWSREGDAGSIYNIWRNARGRNGQQYGLLLGFYDTASDLSMSDNRSDGWSASGRIETDLGGPRAVSTSSYRKVRSDVKFDPDYTPLVVAQFDTSARQDAFIQEVQLLSPNDSAIEWIAGAFYMKRNVKNYVLNRGLAFGAFGGGRERVVDLDVSSIASFGQITIPVFGDTTRLTGGLRFTHDRQRFTGAERAFSRSTFVDAAPETQTSDEFTFRAILDHDLAPDLLAYASFNRGYSAGQLPGFGTPRSRPEFLDAYEVGLKGKLGGRVRFSGAAFYYDYTDLQVEIVNPVNIVDAINAPSAKIFGAELEASVTLGGGFSLSGNMAYTHSEYGTFLNAPFFVPTLPGGNAQVTGDATGRQLIGTPRFTANAAADYTIGMADGSSLGLTVNGSFVGRTYWDVENRVDSGPRLLLNGQLQWTPPGSHYYLRGWVKNATNKEYYQLAAASAALGDRAQAGAPRTYGVAVGFNF